MLTLQRPFGIKNAGKDQTTALADLGPVATETVHHYEDNPIFGGVDLKIESNGGFHLLVVIDQCSLEPKGLRPFKQVKVEFDPVFASGPDEAHRTITRPVPGGGVRGRGITTPVVLSAGRCCR